jgi:cytochrome oxidase Cu insertion factor (SCO1/SenC/PrrC family)
VRRIIVIGALVLAGCAPSVARTEDKPPEVKVGDKAPAFKLTDQTGKERSLDDFLKGGPVALVFYRSASW